MIHGRDMNIKKQVESYKNELVYAVQKLIQIRSVHEDGVEGMPFGEGINDALNFVLRHAENMGFVVKNLDGHCGYIEYGEGELYIGILSHVDTCPEGDMWAVPPFGGQIMNNRIYGRGSMDNKGPLMAALYGLKAVMDSGVKPNKKIRFIIGTDEERYYKDIEYYLKKEKPPIAGFTLDGQFPVVFAEKGLAMMEYMGTFPQQGGEIIGYIRGGASDNTVPGHCETLLITERKSEIVTNLSLFARDNRHNMTARIVDNGVIIESFGMETHGMALELGVNAICQLIQFLCHIEFGCDAVKSMISFLNKSIGMDLYGAGLGVDCEYEFSGSLTLNWGIISMENDDVRIRFDVRFPVTCDFEKTSEKIAKNFVNNGFREIENTYWDPIYFPKEHFLIKILLDAYQYVTKDYREPISSGSGSYSKVMPNVAAFGAIFPGESQAWHQVNEYIDIDNLMKMTEIYATATSLLSTRL